MSVAIQKWLPPGGGSRFLLPSLFSLFSYFSNRGVKIDFFGVYVRYVTLADGEAFVAIFRSAWYNTVMKARNLYEKDSVRLPRQDFPEFRKVLVP